MATTYTIDGTAASYAPFRVQWMPNIVGTDHNGAQIQANKWDIVLTFQPCSPTYARQWQSLQDGGSHTLDLPLPDSTHFVTLSPVYVVPEQRSGLEDINSTGFSVRVKNATKTDIA